MAETGQYAEVPLTGRMTAKEDMVSEAHDKQFNNLLNTSFMLFYECGEIC